MREDKFKADFDNKKGDYDTDECFDINAGSKEK